VKGWSPEDCNVMYYAFMVSNSGKGGI